MQDVTEEMIRDVFAEDARVPATLITFEAADLEEPIRATDYRGDLGDGLYGIVSRGVTYQFFPFAFTFGGASAEEPERQARLEIGNVDGAILHAIRSIEARPYLTAELVRVSAPDHVELAMSRSPLSDVDANAASIEMTLRSRNFDQVYACAKRYVIARTPSLF
jgi:hypothetical protein